MRNKSVCIIAETEEFGGAEVHTLELINVLLSSGYSIEMMSCKSNCYDNSLKPPVSCWKINTINPEIVPATNPDISPFLLI